MDPWEAHYKRNGAEAWPKKEPYLDIENIKKFVAGKKVLDVGCGPYFPNAKLLYDAGYNVTAIDISEECINIAKKIAKEQNIKIKFEVSDITKLQYPDESFDLVICIAVLCHVVGDENRKKAADEMYRVLTNKGGIILLVFSDNKENEMFGKQKIEEKTVIKKNDLPVHYFSKTEMEELFEQFEIISLKEIETTNRLGRKIYMWKLIARK